MPRKSDSIPINNESLDRRVKLTAEQKEEIHKNELGLSQRALARAYGVSRRTITFILNPDSLVENKKRREERGGGQVYYNREKHTNAIREHRNYKKELFAQGKIKKEETMKLYKQAEPPAVIRIDINQRGNGNKGLTVDETDAKYVAGEISKLFNKDFTTTFNPTHQNLPISIHCYYQKGQERDKGNAASVTVYGLTLEKVKEIIVESLEK